MYHWANIKGINVVGTGDFTHPLWLNELKEKLEPDGTGFFKLKNPPKKPPFPGISYKESEIRFCLSAEISLIYKHNGKVRKVHNLIFAPDFETVTKINARLANIGNLTSDGRPILGLSAQNLLEIVLKCSEQAFLVPAHIWTPWFSLFGSKSGYDDIEECFGELSKHIFALETGLSSDPQMNWLISKLDEFTLISNSDAHSPQKLGREANLFDTSFDYISMFKALKTKNGFSGTYEFFPEEGKYHLDGHRNCNLSLEPEETLKYKKICPECGKALTIGVLHRVKELSDRQKPVQPEGAPGFEYIIPLPEIIGEIKKAGPETKTVQQVYHKIISDFGNEFLFLRKAPIEDIQKKQGFILSEAIRRLRNHEVKHVAGYDGQFGIIHVFNEGEIAQLTGQLHLTGTTDIQKMSRREYQQTEILNIFKEPEKTYRQPTDSFVPNSAQKSVFDTDNSSLLVVAGPGTGKTFTLISWLASKILANKVFPKQIIAVTFTNKAADEMKNRLNALIGELSDNVTIGTFHAICFTLVKEYFLHITKVYDENDRLTILRFLFNQLSSNEISKLSKSFTKFFELDAELKDEDIRNYAGIYREYLNNQGAVDISDIINKVICHWTVYPEALEQFRNKYLMFAVDEFQDINPLQYKFLMMAAQGKTILVIGDPDQAIYGFRGSDVKLFFSFMNDFNAKEIYLSENYRSSEIILEAAGNIISNNKLKSGITMLPLVKGGNKVKVYNADNPDNEARYIVSEIKKLVGGTENLSSGYSSDYDKIYGFGDIAVLFRLHSVGNELLKELKKSEIPVCLGDGSSFLSEHPFDIIKSILELFLDNFNLVALDNLLTRCYKWEKSPKNIFLNRLFENKKLFYQASLVQLSENCRIDIQNIKQLLNDFSVLLKDKGLQNALISVLTHLLPDDLLDEGQILKKESILMLADESGNDIEQFLRKMLLSNYTDTGRIKSDKVRLLTFHAAKGLEFPAVFIAGAEQGITPLLHYDSDPEEERRLFYVALTRAKEEVHITYSSVRKRFNIEDKCVPSSFLSEISDHLKEFVTKPVGQRKKRLSGNQLKLF
ncbi:MAG: UvrD-helicase domain-containing protein [Bacteroidia bacterium]|nr:UvrD-helicase domain-containing protein [Bacteroidia bacterium]